MQQVETRASEGFTFAPGSSLRLPPAFMFAEPGDAVCDLGREALEDTCERERVRDGRSEGLLVWQIKRVRDYIDAGLHGRVSLSAAASQARLSPGYFSRCFRQSFGVTFSRYVASRRVAWAQRLMLENAGKLCQIALTCGFSDQAHFTRTFGAVIGRPPAQWRRQAIGARQLV